MPITIRLTKLDMSPICRLLSMLLACLLLDASISGCAATPYRYERLSSDMHAAGKSDSVVIKHDSPGPFVQRLSDVADIPRNHLPFRSRRTHHEISAETEQKITEYLEKNDLKDVYVCVNQYDPAGEWRRLRSNRTISPAWRYSLGIVEFARYALLPDPVFCSNNYNPYTNRLSINLDEPANILFEAAYAKDVYSQPRPGTYVAITSLPVVSLVPTMRAINEVVSYAQSESDWETEQGAYRRLYPQIGRESTPVAIFLLPVWWENALFGLAASGVGHLAGRYVESQRLRELAEIKGTPAPRSKERDQSPMAEPAESILQISTSTQSGSAIRQTSGP